MFEELFNQLVYKAFMPSAFGVVWQRVGGETIAVIDDDVKYKVEEGAPGTLFGSLRRVVTPELIKTINLTFVPIVLVNNLGDAQ